MSFLHSQDYVTKTFNYTGGLSYVTGVLYQLVLYGVWWHLEYNVKWDCMESSVFTLTSKLNIVYKSIIIQKYNNTKFIALDCVSFVSFVMS